MFDVFGKIACWRNSRAEAAKHLWVWLVTLIFLAMSQIFAAQPPRQFGLRAGELGLAQCVSGPNRCKRVQAWYQILPSASGQLFPAGAVMWPWSGADISPLPVRAIMASARWCVWPRPSQPFRRAFIQALPTVSHTAVNAVTVFGRAGRFSQPGHFWRHQVTCAAQRYSQRA